MLIEIKDKPPSTGNPGIDRAIPWAKAPEMDAELWESLEEELNEVPSSIKFLMDNDDLAMPYAEWCSGNPKCTKRIHINARKLSAAQVTAYRDMALFTFTSGAAAQGQRDKDGTGVQ